MDRTVSKQPAICRRILRWVMPAALVLGQAVLLNGAPDSRPTPGAYPIRSPQLNKLLHELRKRQRLPAQDEAPKHETYSSPNSTELTTDGRDDSHDGQQPDTPVDPIKSVERNEATAKEAWPHPTRLMNDLSVLTESTCREWSTQVTQGLELLQAAPTLQDAGAVASLHRLLDLANKADSLAPNVRPTAQQTALRIAAYGLRRRVELWQSVATASAREVEQQVVQVASSIDRRTMLAQIESIRKLLRQTSHGAEWAEFLLLDDLEAVARSQTVHDPDCRQTIAAQILSCKSIDSPTDKQRQFLRSEPMHELETELRRWVTQPVNFHELLASLEAYELRSFERIGSSIAKTWEVLRWSPFPEYQNVSHVMNTHYRNANLRITVTEEFVNRMIPAMQDVRSPVRERILGADVSGQSNSRMQLQVDMLNDPQHIRLRMHADGDLAANTRSTTGAVTLHNLNRSSFVIEKLFIVGQEGIRSTPAKASANGRSSLVGLQTRFDPFPIVGGLVRRIAAQKAFESRGLTRSIFENRVASKAQQQVDTQVQQQIAKAELQLQQQLLTPLEDMQLNPRSISLSSTDQRAIYRGRLAGDHQLAAFTPRPHESLNNMMSIQVHSSAINNLLRQIDLDGKSGNLRDVIQSVLDQFKLEELEVPEDVPDDVSIQMAASDSLRIDCDHDRVSIILRIAEISRGRQKWRHFAVRAHYVPDAQQGFACNLVREDYIELEGLKLSFNKQVELRSIFGIVFSKNRPIPLIHPELTQDQRLHDLRVDQFVARDGWVSLSIGTSLPTQQTAHRTSGSSTSPNRSARNPSRSSRSR